MTTPKNCNNSFNEKLLWFFSCLFLVLALVGWQQGLNQHWFLSWNQAGNQLPDWAWANLTLMADTLFAIAILLILACYKPRLLTQSLLLLILGGMFVHIFKQGLNVARPPAVLESGSFHLIGPALKSESFPSGHAFTAMSCATLLILNQSRIATGLLVLVLGILAALSRTMVGAHWPLDILVGGGSGILIALLCVGLEKRFLPLQHHGIKLFSISLLTLATIALAFHEDRYPDTQGLSVVTSIAATVIALKQFWLPFVKLLLESDKTRNNQH